MNVTADQHETLAPPKPAAASTSATTPVTAGKPASGAKRRLVRAAALAGAAAATLAATAVAATSSVTIAGAPVAINTKTKTFAIPVTCVSEADPCAGVLDVKTATRIRPYSSSPAKIEKVGTFPFSIPAGTTAKVTGRVYGPALAEAMLRGKVKLSLVARLGTPAAAGSRVVLFTYKRR
jgi:hypothetical protein